MQNISVVLRALNDSKEILRIKQEIKVSPLDLGISGVGLNKSEKPRNVGVKIHRASQDLSLVGIYVTHEYSHHFVDELL